MPSAEAEKNTTDGTRSVPAAFRGVNGHEAVAHCRGQSAEIDRIQRMYPHLTDDQFVAEHRDEWLANGG